MRKLIALFKNETLKTLKRVAILISLIVMIAAIGGCAAIGKSIDMFISDRGYMMTYSDMAENSKTSYDYYADELTKIENGAVDPEESEDYYYLKSQCVYYEIRYRIYLNAAQFMHDPSDYRASLVDDLQNELDNAFWPTQSWSAQVQESYEKLEMLRSEYLKKADDLLELLKSESPAEFFDYFKETVIKGEYPESVKNAYAEADGWLRSRMDDMAPEAVVGVSRQILNYALLAGSLKDGVSYSSYFGGYYAGEEMSEFETREVKKQADSLAFKLKKGYSDEEAFVESGNAGAKRSSLEQLTTVGVLFSLVIVVMWAGSSISVEMSNGSIKSLIIAPVRRGKIFAAKFMVLCELVLALSAVNYIVSYIFATLMYGFRYTGSIVYVNAFGPHAMPFWLALLLELLIDGIAVLLFGSIAMCLSSLTKNTAVSVAVPMGVFLVGLLVDLILSELVTNRPYVLAMMPIQNLGNLHFTGGQITSIFSIIGETRTYPMSSLFSYIYVLVLIIAFVWCAADSFCRRDIT